MNEWRVPSRAGASTAVLLVCALSVVLFETFGCTTSRKPPSENTNQTSPAPKASPSATDRGGSHPTKAAPLPPETAAPPPQHVQHARPVEHSAAIAPSPVASGDEQIDQAIANLKKGNLAYNTPTKMKTGQSARVVARIGSDKVSVQTLENGMPAGPGSQTATAATPVSTTMKMSLTSADFDITALSSEEQIVAGDTPTTWEWQIVPKHSGTLSLHLAAVVELDNLSRDFTTVDRNVAVQVDPVNAAESFFQANTVWVLGVIGAAIASLWAWFKKQKKTKSADWETP